MKLFEGGVPVKPSVDLLMDKIHPVPGKIYSHEDIARTCEQPYKTSRYRSIICSWKKRLLRERGLDIVAETGVGYRVLKDSERISHGNRKAMSGLKQIKCGGECAMRAEEGNLTESERRQRMQLMRMTADLVKIGKESEHQFVVLGKVTSIQKSE